MPTKDKNNPYYVRPTYLCGQCGHAAWRDVGCERPACVAWYKRITENAIREKEARFQRIKDELFPSGIEGPLK